MTSRAGGQDRARRAAIWFLALQGAAAACWWLLILLVPPVREPFLPRGASESILFAFIVPDLPLFVGGSIAAAVGLHRGARWAWPALCVHAGAAAYAALYCLAVPIVAGGAWLSAIFMAPSLAGPAFFAWRLAPGRGGGSER